MYIHCRLAANPDPKFGIKNSNSKSDQYSNLYVTWLHAWILEYIPIPPHFWMKWIINTFKKKQNISQLCNHIYLYIHDVPAIIVHTWLIIVPISPTLPMRWEINKIGNCKYKNIYDFFCHTFSHCIAQHSSLFNAVNKTNTSQICNFRISWLNFSSLVICSPLIIIFKMTGEYGSCKIQKTKQASSRTADVKIYQWKDMEWWLHGWVN